MSNIYTTCEKCKAEIEEGDEYYLHCGIRYCVDCVEQRSHIAFSFKTCSCCGKLIGNNFYFESDDELLCRECFDYNTEIKEVKEDE